MISKVITIKSNLKTEGNKVYFYPQQVSYNTCKNEEFAEFMSRNANIPIANVHAVLSALGPQLIRFLGNGHKVKIDGLGTLSLNLTGRITFDEKGMPLTDDLSYDTIKIYPDKQMQQHLNGIDIALHTDEVKVPKCPTIEESEEIVAQLLSEAPFFYAYNFKSAAHISSSSAYRILKALEDNGTITRMGKNRQYVYVQGPAMTQESQNSNETAIV